MLDFAHIELQRLGESAGVGLAGGRWLEQQVDLCLLLCLGQWGSLKMMQPLSS